MKTIKVFSPATIGNFIVGFDVLGACLATLDRTLGDELVISDEQPSGYSAEGEFAYKLPDNEHNLVITTAEFFNRKLVDIKKQQPIKLNFTLFKNLPIGSGLGSSSSSIVATLYGLNQWYESPFTQQQLLLWSAQIEGSNSGSIHYDNVAPCLLGGLQLINSELEDPCQPIPFFNDLYFAICFPDIEITTKSARAILPDTINLIDTITMQGRLAGFIASCFQKNKSRALDLLKDDTITPKRKQLIPDYDKAEVLARENGALTFCLSGSGPTCFAICRDEQTARDVSEKILNVLSRGEHAFHCVATLDVQGARLL
ncbi:homoserine kinase [Pleionea sediminis]|uniref:homoserine kinase n=1 Tax=Pleionea sediminis TaxID=2569479 RepID=UPI00118715F0|nr:homoserine kinase [Pleionea sediminis]